MTEVIETKIESLEKLKIDEELFLDENPPTPIKRGKGRPKKPVEEIDPDAPPKEKRIMSEKQKAILENARKVRMANFEKRKEERQVVAEEKELEKEQRKKEVERKIIKKAVSIKKKQIVEEAILNDELDDEIPDEIVQKVIKKQRAKKATPQIKQPVEPEPEPIKSKYTFV
jgi:hypothetical protein